MKLTQVTVAAVCVTMAIVACQKEKNLPGQSPNFLKSDQEDSKDMLKQLFDAYQAQETQHFSLSAEKGGRVTTEEGVEFSVAPHSLHNPDGSLAQGIVDVAVYVASDNTSRALANFTTEAAYNPDQPYQLLNSAVSFDIEITNNEGQELSTSADQGVVVVVPAAVASNEDGTVPTPDPTMTVWAGEQSQDQPRDKAWEENNIPLEIVGENYRFTMPLPCTRINLDVRVTDWSAAIPFRIALPAGYTDANAEVFIFFDGYPNMTASMDVFNSTTNLFCEHGGMADNGISGKIVAIGRHPVSGGLVYHSMPFTTSINDGAGGFLETVPMMTSTTVSALELLIGTL